MVYAIINVFLMGTAFWHSSYGAMLTDLILVVPKSGVPWIDNAR
jgi:hypothetical protein